MARLVVYDGTGLITVEVEANGAVLGEALDHEKAESVVRCAVLMALCALAEDGRWPRAVLEHMAAFMMCMRQDVRSMHLM
jgi:hypothetical protein